MYVSDERFKAIYFIIILINTREELQFAIKVGTC